MSKGKTAKSRNPDMTRRRAGEPASDPIAIRVDG
jgi:hypothetical protein